MVLLGKLDADLDNLGTMLNANYSNKDSNNARAATSTLYNNMVQANRNEKDAPGNARDATNAYYASVYESDDSQLRVYYNAEAEPLFQALKTEKDALVGQISQGIYYYGSQLSFLESIERGTIEPGVVISTNPPEINTTLRKSEGYQLSDTMVLIWTNIMNCIIFVYACLLLYVFRNNLLDPLVLLTITMTFAAVFVLEPMLKIIYYIPESIFSYIGWGYSSVEFSKWWYLWIPASLAAIYIIISSLL